jgi:hypothetical protein
MLLLLQITPKPGRRRDMLATKKSIKAASTYYLHAPQICLSAAVVVVVIISG